MSEIMVARRSGIIRCNDRTAYRLKGGETLAHAAHPAVVDRPEAWRPVEVHLSAAGGADDIPTEGSVTAPLDPEERAAYEGLLEVLTGVVEELEDAGYPAPPEEDREPGWFAVYVLEALNAERRRPAPLPVAPSAIPAPPRPAARKAAPKKAAPGGEK